MLTEPTRQKLRDLRLPSLARAWAAQQQDPSIQALSFDERLGLLVDAELLARQNKRLQRNLRDAKLKVAQACLEDVDGHSARGLDKAQLRELGTCRWIQDHQNVLITGPTGVGKTYLACALAQQLCRSGGRAAYRRALRLSQELTLARADGSYSQLLARFAKTDLLVIDDWGLSPLTAQDRQDLLEILEDRYGLRSTIVTSQLPVAAWHDFLGEPTLADAILDRLLHNSHRLVLSGPSRRKATAMETTNPKP
jgi:DNA replication protein DnaC